MVDSIILLVEVYNAISGSIQYYQGKYIKRSVEVNNTISRSIQYYQRKYRILSAEVYNTISGRMQYYIQCILLVLHSFGSGSEFRL